MLTWDEEDFLSKIPENKKVFIQPYDRKIKQIADEIASKASTVVPGLEIKHMGASALEISGQGDIDIYIFSKPEDFDKYVLALVSVFGEPKGRKYDSVVWTLNKDSHEIELYLTDPTSKPMQRQIAIFEALRKDKNLRDEYEKLKEGLNGKSFREYQRKKFEFYHRILDSIA